MKFEAMGEIKTPEKKEKPVTDQSLRNKVEQAVKMFCKDFTVEGEENLKDIRRLRDEEPDSTFVIASSHISNLDAPAAVKALGAEFNLQIAVSSKNLGLSGPGLLLKMAGKEYFSGLEYVKKKGMSGTHGVFNPENFDELEEKIEEGKTPWIAIHPFTTDGKMKKSRIGAVYLAQKSGSYIIPTALELNGGSISLEGITEFAKGAISKAETKYHVGKPIKLDPLNVEIIEQVLEKRKRGEKPTPEELAQFKETTATLRMQADEVAMVISKMLPPEMRGEYAEEK